MIALLWVASVEQSKVCVCCKLTSGLALSDGRRRGIYFDSVVVSPSVYNQPCVRADALVLLANRWSTGPRCRVVGDVEQCGLPSLPVKLTLEQLLVLKASQFAI